MTKIEIEIPEYLRKEASRMIDSGDFEDISELTMIALSYFSGRYSEEKRQEAIKEA